MILLFTPTIIKPMKKSKSESSWKIISIIATALPGIFLAGHLSYAVETIGVSSRTVSCFLMHIKMHPFDIFHFHPVVFLYAAGIWLIGVIGILSKRTLPKAQMKGVEKGSNDYMTKEELNEFLKNNTSEVVR